MKLLKIFASLTTFIALTACSGSVSSDPKTITEPNYSGSEKTYPEKVSIVSVFNNDKKTGKVTVEHGKDQHVIQFQASPVNEIAQRNSLTISDVTPYGQGSSYFVGVSYPETFTKEDLDKMASQLIWPIIIRTNLSQEESRAVIQFFEQYASDYVKTYALSQSKNTQDIEALKKLTKYKDVKYHLDYKKTPHLTVFESLNPVDSKNMMTATITLESGNNYTFNIYSTHPKKQMVYSNNGDKNYINNSTYISEYKFRDVIQILTQFYNEVKNDKNVNHDKGEEVFKKIAKFKLM